MCPAARVCVSVSVSMTWTPRMVAAIPMRMIPTNLLIISFKQLPIVVVVVVVLLLTLPLLLLLLLLLLALGSGLIIW